VDMHRAVRAIHFTHAVGVAPRSTFHHGRVRSNRKKTKNSRVRKLGWEKTTMM